MYATSQTATTPAKEKAEVFVKMVGASASIFTQVSYGGSKLTSNDVE